MTLDKSKLLSEAEVRKDFVVIAGQHLTVREIGSVEFGVYGKIANDQTDDNDVVTKKGDQLAATAYMIECCVVDENDKPVFTKEEATALAKNARTAMKIVNKVMNLSGFGEGEEKHPVAN